MRPFRRRGVRALERRADVAALRRVLTERDMLRETGGALVDVALGRRLDAVAALARLGDLAAIDALAPALYDPQMRVRAAALEAAGIAPPPEFLKHLAVAVASWRDDGLRELRGHALELLVRTADPELAVLHAKALLDLRGEELGEVDRDAVRRLLAADTSGAIAEAMAARLIPELLGDDRSRRERAATLMVALGDRAAEALIAALRDEALRPAAIRVLGRLRDERATPLLLEVLRAGLVAERVAAADALGELRDPRTADDLLQAAFAEEAELRDAAINALDRLGPAGIVVAVTGVLDPLLGALARHDPGATLSIERAAPLPKALADVYGATARAFARERSASASTASAASIQAVDHRANGVRTVNRRRTW
jgi:HEAT repeat protein